MFFIVCRYQPYLLHENDILRGAELVSEAHKRGLLVHTWTFTNSHEDQTISKDFDDSEIKGIKKSVFFIELISKR
jgi:glycerophosphoryl diester phosphodiesterase